MTNAEKIKNLFQNTDKVALATSCNDIPNVRIVNVCYDETRPNVLYFSSDRDDEKISEFKKNPCVAFTSIPSNGVEHLRSKDSIVKKSNYSIHELAELFISQIEGYDHALHEMKPKLDVYEIHIHSGVIILRYEGREIITF